MTIDTAAIQRQIDELNDLRKPGADPVTLATAALAAANHIRPLLNTIHNLRDQIEQMRQQAETRRLHAAKAVRRICMANVDRDPEAAQRAIDDATELLTVAAGGVAEVTA